MPVAEPLFRRQPVHDLRYHRCSWPSARYQLQGWYLSTFSLRCDSAHRSGEFAATFESPPEREFVGILQVAAHR